MARPRLGEGESKRLQMVITEDELEIIDDWRYANHIPSRSEAIRRMCQIANSLEVVIPDATDHSGIAVGAARTLYAFARECQVKAGKGETVDFEQLVGRCADLLDRTQDIYLMLMRENNRIIPLVEAKIDNALEISIREEDVLNRIINAYLDEGETYLDSRLMSKAWDSMSEEERDFYQNSTDEQRHMFWRTKVVDQRAELDAYLEDSDT